MKLINGIAACLLIIFLIGCGEKPKEKSEGDLYKEAQTLLTDVEKGDPVEALKLDEKEKAFEDFNAAIQIDSSKPEIYLTRGEIYADLKEFEKAFEDYNHAISLKPKYADAYFERGKVYFSMGDYNKAYEDFITALKFDPKHAKARLYIDEVRPLMK